MKKQVLLVASLFFILSAGIPTLSAQEAAIKSRLSTYIEATNAGNWDTVLDMVYEKLFDQVPKDQMKQAFSQMSAMGMKMEVQDYTIAKMSDKMQEDGADFVIVEYDAQEKLMLTGPQFSNEAVIEQMKGQFNSIYGADKVSYDKETNTFSLKGQKTMLAVSKDGSDEWKFIEYNTTNPMQAQLFQQIVPEKILTKLKATKE